MSDRLLDDSDPRSVFDLGQDAPAAKALADREADLVAALAQRQDHLVEKPDSPEETVIARNVRIISDEEQLAVEIDADPVAEAETDGFRLFAFGLQNDTGENGVIRLGSRGDAGEVGIGDVAIPSVSAEMQLVFAAAHLIHHDLRVNLRSYLDLALTTSLPTLGEEELLCELAATDLEPELGSLFQLISGLFEGFRPPIDLGAAIDRQEQGALAETIRRRLLRIDSYRGEEALAEISVRGWRSRLSYAWKLLVEYPDRV